MKYDNVRDQFKFGYDRGQIIDGTIVHDPEKGEYVIVDSDGSAFSTQEWFKLNEGKQVRFTCASFETIATIERMIQATRERNG
jgi:hypothetical protein